MQPLPASRSASNRHHAYQTMRPLLRLSLAILQHLIDKKFASRSHHLELSCGLRVIAITLNRWIRQKQS